MSTPNSFPLFPLPESLAYRLLDESQARQITVPEFIEQMLDDLSPEDLRPKSINYSSQMDEALERAERIPIGEEFTLARLFPNDWKSLPSPTAFGKIFRKKLEEQGIGEHIGRDNTMKMAKYIRT